MYVGLLVEMQKHIAGSIRVNTIGDRTCQSFKATNANNRKEEKGACIFQKLIYIYSKHIRKKTKEKSTHQSFFNSFLTFIS